MEFIFLLTINILRIFKWAIIARVLMSWIRPDPSNKLVILLNQSTEPVLGFFRGILPRTGMFDLSPLVAFIVLDFAQLGLVKLMANFA